MSKKPTKPDQETRRVYTQKFKENAVGMLSDGHSASSICERLDRMQREIIALF